MRWAGLIIVAFVAAGFAGEFSNDPKEEAYYQKLNRTTEDKYWLSTHEFLRDTPEYKRREEESTPDAPVYAPIKEPAAAPGLEVPEPPSISRQNLCTLAKWLLWCVK